MDDDALADGALAGLGEIVDQVVVELAEHGVAEDRAGDFRQRVVEATEAPSAASAAPKSCSRGVSAGGCHVRSRWKKAPVSGLRFGAGTQLALLGSVHFRKHLLGDL